MKLQKKLAKQINYFILKFQTIKNDGYEIKEQNIKLSLLLDDVLSFAYEQGLSYTIYTKYKNAMINFRLMAEGPDIRGSHYELDYYIKKQFDDFINILKKEG